MTMEVKRFVIMRGRPTENVPRSYIEDRFATALEIFSEFVETTDYETDETILNTDSEAEARKMFATLRSDVSCTRTPAGYEIAYDIYELGCETGEYDDGGDWESIEYHKIQVAPLAL